MTDDKNYSWYMFVRVMKEYFDMSVSWTQDIIILRKKSTKLISITKNNKMSHKFVEKLLGTIGVDMKDFEEGYQGITKRSKNSV